MTKKEARDEANRRWFRGHSALRAARWGWVSLHRKDQPKRYEVGLSTGLPPRGTTITARGDSWEEAFAAMDRLEADLVRRGGGFP